MNITTKSKAMNWLINKIELQDDLTEEDKEAGVIVFKTGCFQGVLPRKMAQEVKAFCNWQKRATNKAVAVYFKSEVVGNIARLGVIKISFGQAKQTQNCIMVTIDYEKFANPSKEEVAKMVTIETI